MPRLADWTILVYIAAHNDLDVWGQRSLEQILTRGSTGPVKVAALFDGASESRRILARTRNGPAVSEDLQNYDSGDPNSLVETVRWAFKQKPARRYGLVLWSHGTGWKPSALDTVAQEVRAARSARNLAPSEPIAPQEVQQRAAEPGSRALFRSTISRMFEAPSPQERAILFDDGSGHSLDTIELGRVVRAVYGVTGQPLDLLGMDACLMATLEVAHEVRSDARTLVASEEIVPSSSWPYDRILKRLQATPDMDGRDVATLVVDEFVNYYRENPPAPGQGDVTALALDLARLQGITDAADGLAGALTGEMASQHTCLDAVQKACRDRETHNGERSDSKFRYYLWDLRTLASGLADRSDSQAIRAAAQALVTTLQPGSAVLAEGHQGDWFDGIGGLTAYLIPPVSERISPYYADVAFARDTRWLEMLETYRESIGRQPKVL